MYNLPPCKNSSLERNMLSVVCHVFKDTKSISEIIKHWNIPTYGVVSRGQYDDTPRATLNDEIPSAA